VIDQRTRLLLEDMLAHANYALDYIGGLTIQQFTDTRVMVHAATHAAETVGEAASQIDPDVRNQLTSIPWRQAIDLRNKLIHGYRSLQPVTLYETIRDDFPPLIAELERILNSQGQGQP
jgi:uncharacterized protein with HEPN domain